MLREAEVSGFRAFWQEIIREEIRRTVLLTCKAIECVTGSIRLELA